MGASGGNRGGLQGRELEKPAYRRSSVKRGVGRESTSRTPELVATSAASIQPQGTSAHSKGWGRWTPVVKLALAKGHNQPEVTRQQGPEKNSLASPSSFFLRCPISIPHGPPQPKAAAWNLSVQPRQPPETPRRVHQEGKQKRAGT